MFEHITSFQKKLDLFDGRFSNSVLTHFPCLKSRKEEGLVINYERYSTMIKKWCAVFGDRFSDFQNLEIYFNIFRDPFNAVVDQSLDQLQLELIDLQSDNDMKRVFGKNNLVSFYKNYVRGKHLNLAEHALKIISLFVSTYCCEQFFSKMKHCKEKHRGQVRPTFDWSTSSCLQFYKSNCSETLQRPSTSSIALVDSTYWDGVTICMNKYE